MRILLLGNAGAGKSTLAGNLIARQPAARLSLDQVAFRAGSERRPIEESVAEAERWIAGHESWILEGCYADILEPLLVHGEELLFLNPGVEVCLAHCRSRPWEPEKFASPEEQERNLPNLLAWVRSYETRLDEYGLARHRALFDAFPGRKREFTHPSQYPLEF
ncbi:MAG: AAA family ATPase [Synechococcus sp.]